jgi:hypothetical protein
MAHLVGINTPFGVFGRYLRLDYHLVLLLRSR